MRHVLGTREFDRAELERLFDRAQELRNGKKTEHLAGKILATLFYHPSTRTRLSFESAMLRLGGGVISTENAKDASSASKGESIEDTIRSVSQYSDVIVIRHTEEGAAARAASVSSVPIINAGDGGNEHPSQAILDLYTIKNELGSIDGRQIAFVGDLQNSRSIRSVAQLLANYKNISLTFVSPSELPISDDVKVYLKEHGVSYVETANLGEGIREADVVYMTRIQDKHLVHSAREDFSLRGSHVDSMKDCAIVMHPLPRIDSISTDVDDSPKAAYFRQAGYGLEIRMALLELVCA